MRVSKLMSGSKVSIRHIPIVVRDGANNDDRLVLVLLFGLRVVGLGDNP